MQTFERLQATYVGQSFAPVPQSIIAVDLILICCDQAQSEAAMLNTYFDNPFSFRDRLLTRAIASDSDIEDIASEIGLTASNRNPKSPALKPVQYRTQSSVYAGTCYELVPEAVRTLQLPQSVIQHLISVRNSLSQVVPSSAALNAVIRDLQHEYHYDLKIVQ